MQPVRPALILAILLALSGALAAQDSDPHFASARTSAIAHRSVFVHGYLHGYEQGFHAADLDVQLIRPAREVARMPEFKECVGYRPQFGDKKIFHNGYREGFRVGYADGMAQRSFRAIAEIESIATGMAEDDQPSRQFDRGFALGYRSGQQQGLHDGRIQTTYQTPNPACPSDSALPGSGEGFCAAFVSGFRVGYSDGFVNVARAPVVSAEAGSK